MQENSTNPKDKFGRRKPSAQYTPPLAETWLHVAMQEGAAKYGPFNWRENDVSAGVYYSAARRHLTRWFTGQRFDPETKIHHLAYAMACCAILIDAEANGCLVDDRPLDNNKTADTMDLLEQVLALTHGKPEPELPKADPQDVSEFLAMQGAALSEKFSAASPQASGEQS